MNHKYHNIILSVHFSHVFWPAFVIPPWGWPLTPWRVKWPVWKKSPSLIAKLARDWWVSTTFCMHKTCWYCFACCLTTAYCLLIFFKGNVYQIHLRWAARHHRNHGKCESTEQQIALTCFLFFAVNASMSSIIQATVCD